MTNKKSREVPTNIDGGHGDVKHKTGDRYNMAYNSDSH